MIPLGLPCVLRFPSPLSEKGLLSPNFWRPFFWERFFAQRTLAYSDDDPLAPSNLRFNPLPTSSRVLPPSVSLPQNCGVKSRPVPPPFQLLKCLVFFSVINKPHSHKPLGPPLIFHQMKSFAFSFCLKLVYLDIPAFYIQKYTNALEVTLCREPSFFAFEKSPSISPAWSIRALWFSLPVFSRPNGVAKDD